MAKFLLATLLIFAAVGPARQQPAGRPARATSATHRTLRKTLTVTGPCAVLYSPDAVWIARQKKRGDVGGFYTVAEDAMFYNSQSREYLTRRHIKIIDTDAAWIRFRRGRQLVKEVDLRHSTYGWGVILFNGYDLPREADATSPEDDVKRVFHK